MVKKEKSTIKLTRNQSIALFKRCAHYFKPYKLLIFIASLAMLISGLCNAASAWLVKPALDDIFFNHNPTALFLVPLFFIGVTFGKVSTRTIQNYVMQYCGLRVLEKLRDELYTKIICLPLRFYEGTQIGMLMSRIINDVVAIRSSLPAIVMMIRQVVTMLCLIGNAFYMNARLAFWAVIVLPVAMVPFVYFSRRIRKLSRKNQSKLADISTLLQEVLSGIRVVKAFSTEKKEAERFDKENKRLLNFALKRTLAGEFSSSFMELIGAFGIGAVLWFGGMEVLEGHSTPGEFFSFVAALVMLYDPVKKLTTSNSDLQKALVGAERVFEILDDSSLIIEEGGSIKFDGKFNAMDFIDVSFGYSHDTIALKNVSFSLKEGERIAIVGPSGAGKTTFVNLIPRFYDPSSGSILLNGIELSKYTLPSLRKNMALVSQDNFLFNISIEENIRYGIDGVTKDDVIAAAKSAYAHDFIMDMPKGYETVIGERGVKLSGGQKQRLTIARAIVKNAPLLILDEATSALDSQAESIVQQALDNLMQNRTSIVIAHRLSTIINADKILIMQNGHLVAQGKHEEVLVSSPLYAQLYNMQFNIGEKEDEIL